MDKEIALSVHECLVAATLFYDEAKRDICEAGQVVDTALKLIHRLRIEDPTNGTLILFEAGLLKERAKLKAGLAGLGEWELQDTRFLKAAEVL